VRKSLILVLLFGAAAASAQDPPCTPKMQGLSETQISAVLCAGATAPLENEPMIVAVGGSQFETTVTQATSTLGLIVVNASVVDPVRAQENLLMLSGAETATLNYQTTSVPVKVLPADPLAARNYVRYQWAAGPAKAPNKDPANPATSSKDLNSIRFQGSGTYARGGVFGKLTAKEFRLQSIATIDIDSTDSDTPEFTDTNRAAAGVHFTNLSAGRFWMHGNGGVEGRFDQGFHSGVRNADVVLSVSGWAPFLRSHTLFSTKGEFIAAPLSFTASYGYRNRRQAGTSASGRVFEGTVLYHLFLFDDYQVSLSGKWTVNDMSDRALAVPRTQKLFKAKIAYLLNNQTGFKAVASFEDGSAGAMLKDVRNYFIGVALSKLDLGGKGGSQ
jgi:hypothetical protein